MELGLESRTVLVTGATGGIGAATCRLFNQEGARTIIHYNKNESKARELVSELGNNTLIIQADLSVEEQVVGMFDQITKSCGRLDILVCNAGIWPEEFVGIVDMDYQRWKNTQTIDLDSAFLCCRAFLKQLETYPGDNASIIIVGSTAAIFGEAGHADYSAAKAAITYGLTLSLKNEIVSLARLGRVNAVCPGWTVTPMTEKFLDDEYGVKHVLKTIPLRKIAQAEDVATSIVCLASDRVSGHVSGQIVTVAGGMEGRVLFESDEIDIEKAYRL
ncbi:MAG: SDR family NAD(P)-dependent oxidoreductase [Candidatus Hodarchaeales archaeon]|jgi:3-oxoacyl-[acyl-carrier protein] reductase